MYKIGYWIGYCITAPIVFSLAAIVVAACWVRCRIIIAFLDARMKFGKQRRPVVMLIPKSHQTKD